MQVEQPKTVTPKQAWEMLQANPKTLLVDVRSNMEFLFVGHPIGAVHIPWIDEPDWTVNPHFITEVRQLILGGISEHHDEINVPILLICRSGKRSLEAGEALIAAGIRNVHNIGEGFEGELDAQHHRSSLGGWRFEGLPWEQC